MYHIFAKTPIWRTAPVPAPVMKDGGEAKGIVVKAFKKENSKPEEHSFSDLDKAIKEAEKFADKKYDDVLIYKDGKLIWDISEGLYDKKSDGGPAAQKVVPRKVDLFFQEGTSDKEYHIQLNPEGSGYVVNFQFGRRGGPLNEGTKTPKPVSLDEADKIYEKLLKEKTKKGYK
jgi:predicted DNA-binding WGR domain protein